jgi:hypothetical protein
MQGRHAHVPVKVLGEGALIAEAELATYFSDLSALFLKGFAGGLDAELHDEGLRAGSKGFDELPVKLAWRKMHDFSQFRDRDASAEVLADVGEGAIDLQVGLEDLFFSLKALHGAHQADDAAFGIEKRELVGDEPVWQALIGEKELDDVELGFAGEEDLFVIAAKILGEAIREEIEVVFADDLVFMMNAEAVHEAA